MVVCKVQARLDGGWATHIETAHKESASFHLRVALDLPRGGGRKKPKPLDLTKATVPKGQMSVGRLLEIHKISWWPAALYFLYQTDAPTQRGALLAGLYGGYGTLWVLKSYTFFDKSFYNEPTAMSVMKDQSLSRYPEFAEWKKKTWLMVPKLF